VAVIAATFIDVLHALLMLLWVLGLPLLLWHRWPRLTRGYAWYAVVFIVVNLASQYALGECFLTTIARHFWEHASNVPEHLDDWFTIRFSDLVFRMTPSHVAVKRATQGLIFLTAVGMLYTMRKLRSSKEPVGRA
jgi:hypothetical protein